MLFGGVYARYKRSVVGGGERGFEIVRRRVQAATYDNCWGVSGPTNGPNERTK